jgi:tetratricopeptide (TPR) repeat protein
MALGRSTRALFGFVALAAAAACAGPSRQHRVELNQKVAARNWDAAVQQVDQGKDSQYGNRNAVLYWLDRATILHDAGKYEESDRFLDLAEQRIDELYTASLSKGAASFLVNDSTTDYAGQVHERTLLHVLRALNYAYLGKLEDAVVEARKVTAFLTELNARLGEKPLAYRDDAFAQYLSALLFEEQGREDDARISREAALAAYGWYASELGTPPPSFDPAGDATDGAGELVFLHYVGVAPRKETTTLQVAWGQALVFAQAGDEGKEDPRVKNALAAGIAGNAITVAIPKLVQDPFTVAGSEIEVGPVRAGTVLVEDVGAIARSAFAAALPLVTAKSIARAAIKFALAKVAEKEAKKNLGEGWGALAGIAARVTAAATETADTRSWTILPATFRMARVRLAPGRYPVRVRYLAADGLPLGDEQLPPVEIRAGRRTWVHVRTAG